MTISGPTQSRNSNAAPERGSFPLDHDGECSALVARYLACLKQQRGRQTECRALAKDFLQCRMQHGLMTTDDFGSTIFLLVWRREIDTTDLGFQKQRD